MPGEPNDLLRAAREVAVLTQDQLAELANMQVEQETGKPGAMDADYISKLERGIHRWPNRHYRAALRRVFGYGADAELGFFSTRCRAATVGHRLTPLVRAVMHTRHARALGLSGSHREADCMTAVHQAEDYFTARNGDEPEWITYYGPAHLERDLGRALLYLAVNGGEYTHAQHRLSAAMEHFPKQPSRGKVLTIANLAHLTMARDDPARAVTLGHEALDSMGPIRSDRVFEALRHMRTAGQQHRTMPAVRELNQRVDGALLVAG